VASVIVSNRVSGNIVEPTPNNTALPGERLPDDIPNNR